MNARTKGGAKEEFEQKKQGVNKDALEYYYTKLQLYLHTYVRGLEEYTRVLEINFEWTQESLDAAVQLEHVEQENC